MSRVEEISKRYEEGRPTQSIDVKYLLSEIKRSNERNRQSEQDNKSLPQNIKKYSWSFDGGGELWGNDTHNTIKACIKDAKGTAVENEEEHRKTVYVGENHPFMLNVDVEPVLDLLEEEAFEFAGAAGEDWCSYNPKKRSELDELSQTISLAVFNWMKKYGYAPDFYAVQSIKPYSIEPEKNDAEESHEQER